MNHIFNITAALLLSISVMANCGCSSKPNKIDIEVRLDKGSAAGFFIKVENKEYRGKNMLEAFYKDVKYITDKAPYLKAVFHIDDYINAPELYYQVIKVAKECMKAQLRDLSVAKPKSAKSGEEDFRLNEGIEDVCLTKADCCEKIVKPENKYAIIIINLKGEFLQDRRNRGNVSDASDTIRQFLQEETDREKRGPDGYSLIRLFIRADRKAEFKHIHQLLNICREQEIRINRIEFNCKMNILDLPANLMMPFTLKDGVLTANLFKDTQAVLESAAWTGDANLLINLFGGKDTYKGFEIKAGCKEFRGPTMLIEFYRFVEECKKEQPGLAIIIHHNDAVCMDHVIKVMNECYRAKVKQIYFKE